MRTLLFVLTALLLPLSLYAQKEESLEALRSKAKQLSGDGKLNEAITVYSSLVKRHEIGSQAGVGALDVEALIVLLLKRNLPQTDEEVGDRMKAYEAGRKFIWYANLFAKEQGAGNQFKAFERVKKLNLEIEEALFSVDAARIPEELEVADDVAKTEKELYVAIEQLVEKKDYKEALLKGRLFLDHKESKSFSKLKRAVVLNHMGYCYEQSGSLGPALRTYAHGWSDHMGLVRTSSLAIERWMRILWERNQSGDEFLMSDRQAALKGCRRYVQMLVRFKDKMTKEDVEKFLRVEKLLKSYEAELEKP